jgi:hypothetical protein
MKARHLLPLLLLALALPAFAVTDAEVEARRLAMDLAGAFSNEGFKIRDGCWQGKLEPKHAKVIQVSLYAGNEYWFTLGATAAAKGLKISVHDETGKPLPIEPFADEGRAAAGFAPQASGPYYVRIEAQEGAPASFCLLYSYK